MINCEKVRGRFIYTQSQRVGRSTMERVYRATLLVLYQLALLVGIVVMPVALVADRFGLGLPVHRAVKRLGEKYDQAAG